MSLNLQGHVDVLPTGIIYITAAHFSVRGSTPAHILPSAELKIALLGTGCFPLFESHASSKFNVTQHTMLVNLLPTDPVYYGTLPMHSWVQAEGFACPT